MKVNSAMQSQIASVRQALSTASLQQAMNQDGATVSKLLEGMEEETTESIRQAAEPYKGINIDIQFQSYLLINDKQENYTAEIKVII